MAITMRDFAPAMGFLCEMLPMQRALTDEALAMAWETLPNAAKIQVTRESLAFAVKQRLIDPQPPKEQALHVSLLRYLFPIDRTIRRERGEEVASDRVLIEAGLRPDLAERMAQPDRFHDPAPVRQEQAAAADRTPRLPGGGRPWHPSMMTPEQRRDHVLVVAGQTEAVIAGRPDGRAWNGGQLAQGHWWFQRALEGFWSLKADEGGLAAAWIQRNAGQARAMVAEALSGAEQPTAAALVAADFVGAGQEVGGW